MPEHVFDFDAPLPDIAYLDPSFLLNIIIEDAVFHEQCVSYKDKLKKHHTLLFLSNLGLDEIWHVLIKVQAIKDHGPRNIIEFLNKNPESVMKYSTAVIETTSAILEIPYIHLLEISTEQTLDAMRFIRDHGLLPRDAIHVSTAIDANIKNVITTDRSFTRITDINVYTCR